MYLLETTISIVIACLLAAWLCRRSRGAERRRNNDAPRVEHLTFTLQPSVQYTQLEPAFAEQDSTTLVHGSEEPSNSPLEPLACSEDAQALSPGNECSVQSQAADEWRLTSSIPPSSQTRVAVRNPVTSTARPPRTPGSSPASTTLPRLPTPPPAGASGLRAIRRTVSAPAERTPGVKEDEPTADAPPSPVSVLARAAKFEGLCRSLECSPSPSAAVSRAPSTSGFLMSASSACGSACSSVAGSARSSPRSSSTGEGEGRALWGRSNSYKEGSRSGGSFLQLARVSQQMDAPTSPPRAASPAGSPISCSPSKRLMKPNMPSIAGL